MELIADGHEIETVLPGSANSRKSRGNRRPGFEYKVRDFISSFKKRDFEKKKKEIDYKKQLLWKIDSLENQIEMMIQKIQNIEIGNRIVEEGIREREHAIEQMTFDKERITFENLELQNQLRFYKEKVIKAFNG